MRKQTPEQFAKRMEILAEGVKHNTLNAVKRAAIAADQAVVLQTPVDTGRARANWVVNVGSAATGEVDSTDANAALEQGRSAIGDYKLEQGGIFISNSLPYIGLLENGSSAQAPKGMTAAALLAARKQLRSIKLLDGKR